MMIGHEEITTNKEMEQRVWGWLADVPDPEIPALSVIDLGIVRGVNLRADSVEIEVAPTYSGCPATEFIESSIIASLEGHGLQNVSVSRVLSPPWTTDWITADGREKLRAYGIAPPAGSASKMTLLGDTKSISCPRCGTGNTSLVSEFGSTACKASYKCDECLEPFEYFKCI
jgi:ring-1,2-phenylacetyl-CoA epoxidase subunit PaaD